MNETVNKLAEDAKKEKWLRNLMDDMSPIKPYLDNKNVTDIAIGNEGRLIVEGIGMGKIFTDIYFDEATITRIIYASASILGTTINPENPIVEGVLPGLKCRIEGILKPRAAVSPMYFIRRPSEKIFTLEEYLEQGSITKEKYDLLVEHIKKRSNIAIGGETGSGKTTLLNAIILKMSEFTPDDRFYIVEDASEIQCKAKDVVSIWAEGKDCLKAVATSLRCNVDRIIFGELRYGDVANEVLKAWNSGHTGGVTTIHANSASTMLSRISDLLREVIGGELPDLSQSIQLLIHMIPTPKGKIVNEIVETKSLGQTAWLDEIKGRLI